MLARWTRNPQASQPVERARKPENEEPDEEEGRNESIKFSGSTAFVRRCQRVGFPPRADCLPS